MRMIRKRIILLLAIAIFRATLATDSCSASGQKVKLRQKTGRIEPFRDAYNLSGGVHCTWTFSNNKFPGHALLLIIKNPDPKGDKKESVKNLTIGRKIFRQASDPKCRLYGKNLSDIDVVALATTLANFTAKQHGSGDKYCNAWYIDSQPIKQIVFQSGSNENVTHKKKTFSIVFHYISVQRKSPAESPTVTITGMSNKSCGNGLIFIAAIIAMAVLLAITCSALIYVLCKNRQAKNHVYKIAPKAINPSSEATPPGQDHSNVVYAAIEENVTIETNSATTSRSTYDVPTTNRLRAPTAVSCVSTVSEHHFQYPNSLPVVAEEGEPTQQPVEEFKDVYAIVNKNKK